jgi:hypothetical protein
VTFDDIEMNFLDVGLLSRGGDAIELSYRGKPIMVHRPSEKGGLGIKTKGPLDIDKDGRLSPISGPTTIGAGTLQVGSPGHEPVGRKK